MCSSLCALGYAMVFVAAQGYVLDRTGQQNRAQGFALFIGAIMVATVCGPSIGGILDKDVEPLAPDATLGQVARMLATYDLVGLPIVDAEGHLLGAVTVDDVLDHILPEDWREERHDVVTPEGVRRG